MYLCIYVNIVQFMYKPAHRYRKLGFRNAMRLMNIENSVLMLINRRQSPVVRQF